MGLFGKIATLASIGLPAKAVKNAIAGRASASAATKTTGAPSGGTPPPPPPPGAAGAGGSAARAKTMTGKKTHEQQQKIIEKRVDTTNADKDFDPRPDLKASDRREARKDEDQE